MTNPKKVKWSVKAIKLSKYHYRAVFEVGVQGFTLADEELPKGSSQTEILEAKEHCEFIAEMFKKALGRLGVTA